MKQSAAPASARISSDSDFQWDRWDSLWDGLVDKLIEEQEAKEAQKAGEQDRDAEIITNQSTADIEKIIHEFIDPILERDQRVIARHKEKIIMLDNELKDLQTKIYIHETGERRRAMRPCPTASRIPDIIDLPDIVDVLPDRENHQNSQPALLVATDDDRGSAWLYSLAWIIFTAGLSLTWIQLI